MGDAETSAGQHRHRQLGNHAHVDDGAVAGFQPARFEHVGETADQPVQLLVGDHALVAGLAFPQDRDLVFAMRWSGGDRRSCSETLILPPANHLANGGCHSKHGTISGTSELLPGQFAPELLGIVGGPLVQLAVLLDAVRVRAANKIRGRV